MIFKFRVHKVRPYWSTATPIHSCIVSGCSHTRKAEPLNATDNMGSTKAAKTDLFFLKLHSFVLPFIH